MKEEKKELTIGGVVGMGPNDTRSIIWAIFFLIAFPAL